MRAPGKHTAMTDSTSCLSPNSDNTPVDPRPIDIYKETTSPPPYGEPCSGNNLTNPTSSYIYNETVSPPAYGAPYTSIGLDRDPRVSGETLPGMTYMDYLKAERNKSKARRVGKWVKWHCKLYLQLNEKFAVLARVWGVQDIGKMSGVPYSNN
ncbi:hypothetical protein BU25DRAFT_455980 [Macroventuria anomochaeta]|uniref:Uncharacterized protein n=1 Tax=Macroventuria anomochaeta TaxID=301207 RepID=A0ACB6SA58_9PLEO|nr:uncharacterized protein BU25DRAFT_455980 [Macroventuria anomochaeta]KAF2630209.1 hypothetical protein BU25DRAFT_455980 [Macroventuria anomochaeta]